MLVQRQGRGSGTDYVSLKLHSVLRDIGLGHHRIKPHSPEEDGLLERAYRALREELDGATEIIY